LSDSTGEGSFGDFAHLVKDEPRGEAAHESQGAGDAGEYFELVLLQTFYRHRYEFIGLHEYAGVHVAQEFIVQRGVGARGHELKYLDVILF
jgi:hypothetical protein